MMTLSVGSRVQRQAAASYSGDKTDKLAPTIPPPAPKSDSCSK